MTLLSRPPTWTTAPEPDGVGPSDPAGAHLPGLAPSAQAAPPTPSAQAAPSDHGVLDNALRGAGLATASASAGAGPVVGGIPGAVHPATSAPPSIPTGAPDGSPPGAPPPPPVPWATGTPPGTPQPPGLVASPTPGTTTPAPSAPGPWAIPTPGCCGPQAGSVPTLGTAPAAVTVPSLGTALPAGSVPSLGTAPAQTIPLLGAGNAGVGQPVAGTGAMAGFDVNPYTLRRVEPLGPPPTPKRGRRPWLRLLVVLAVAGAGVAAWRITRPSVHASATSVALAFYQALQHGAVASAAADVEPDQQPAATSGLTSAAVEQFAHANLRGVVIEPATATATSVGMAVVLQECSDNLSCSPLLTIPTVSIAGSWYVDLDAWLLTVPPAPSALP